MEEIDPSLQAIPNPRKAIRPRYLADTSALVRLADPNVSTALVPFIEQGLVARCGPVDLEMLFTARNREELVEQRNFRSLAFPLVEILQSDFDRAGDVMALLAGANLHRAAKLPDLLIAAVAERADLVLLHYDRDYDHIASVTGQQMRWIVPRGSLTR